jgi:hypothetical protein
MSVSSRDIHLYPTANRMYPSCAAPQNVTRDRYTHTYTAQMGNMCTMKQLYREYASEEEKLIHNRN